MGGIYNTQKLGFKNTQERRAWNATHSNEIIEYQRHHSFTDTCLHFHIGGLTLNKIKRQFGFGPAVKSPTASLKKIGFESPASRHAWLESHTAEIRRYAQKHTRSETHKHFHIAPMTLRRMVGMADYRQGWMKVFKLLDEGFAVDSPEVMALGLSRRTRQTYYYLWQQQHKEEKSENETAVLSAAPGMLTALTAEPQQMSLDAFVRLLSDLCIEYRARGAALTELRGAYGQVCAELSEAQRSAEFWQKQTEGIKAKLEELIRK